MVKTMVFHGYEDTDSCRHEEILREDSRNGRFCSQGPGADQVLSGSVHPTENTLWFFNIAMGNGPFILGGAP